MGGGGGLGVGGVGGVGGATSYGPLSPRRVHGGSMVEDACVGLPLEDGDEGGLGGVGGQATVTTTMPVQTLASWLLEHKVGSG